MGITGYNDFTKGRCGAALDLPKRVTLSVAQKEAMIYNHYKALSMFYEQNQEALSLKENSLKAALVPCLYHYLPIAILQSY